MIIKRQREFSTSIYTSQGGVPNDWRKSFYWQDGSQIGLNEFSDESYKLSQHRQSPQKYKKTSGGGKIYVGKDGMQLVFHEGKDNIGRKIIHDFTSTKDPVSAYRDFLRGNRERMAQGDIFGAAERTITNKEIKDAIKKNARKTAIVSKAKKVAPWAVAGSLATSGTVAVVKAIKKKKSNKKDK